MVKLQSVDGVIGVIGAAETDVGDTGADFRKIEGVNDSRPGLEYGSEISDFAAELDRSSSELELDLVFLMRPESLERLSVATYATI